MFNHNKSVKWPECQWWHRIVTGLVWLWRKKSCCRTYLRCLLLKPIVYFVYFVEAMASGNLVPRINISFDGAGHFYTSIIYCDVSDIKKKIRSQCTNNQFYRLFSKYSNITGINLRLSEYFTRASFWHLPEAKAVPIVDGDVMSLVTTLNHLKWLKWDKLLHCANSLILTVWLCAVISCVTKVQ